MLVISCSGIKGFNLCNARFAKGSIQDFVRSALKPTFNKFAWKKIILKFYKIVKPMKIVTTKIFHNTIELFVMYTSNALP